MYVEQIFTSCLAEMAYYIESNGEAVVIDPLRETTPYIEKANERGAKIKYVFLTHFHADFVSGHVDLAKETGATIVFGPNAKAAFDFHSGTDNEEFKIGDITLKLLHTPGHTMESSSYLLVDDKGETPYIFTGDALFIGDVGRPDLAVKSDLTQADLAGHLFDSLRNKIMLLPDDIIVYPNHGAGSACGKNMSKETFDTLGHQKEVNYALRADMTKEEFIKEVTTGLVAPPQYFPKNVGMNKGINKSYGEILANGTTALSVEEFKKLSAQEETLVLDVRPTPEFIKGHIPGSLFIGLDGGFAPWVGALIKDINTPIILIVEEGKEKEGVTRLSRVGYDNTLGFLKGGIDAWKSASETVETVESVSTTEFAEKMGAGSINVLDVRKKTEHFSERLVHDALTHSALDNMMDDHGTIKDQEYYVHCAGGYRSVIAISILQAKGFKNLINVEGGFGAMRDNENLITSDWVCSSEMV
jgi:glyoxylase-like metal-dependent hydrolase (beta-lactamase superfamily II)/rhodanese-related sulfurtransferase